MGAFAADPLRDPLCRSAGTLHLGGTLDEMVRSEAAPWRGEHASKPYVLLVQPTVIDPTRAPAGRHVAWAYCHVPNGSTVDMSEAIERQIERFAPGFRETILSRHAMNSGDLQHYNPNLVGGDINGGAQYLTQLFMHPSRRPTHTRRRARACTFAPLRLRRAEVFMECPATSPHNLLFGEVLDEDYAGLRRGSSQGSAGHRDMIDITIRAQTTWQRQRKSAPLTRGAGERDVTIQLTRKPPCD